MERGSKRVLRRAGPEFAPCLVALCLVLCGCESWPLYRHLPVEAISSGETGTLNLGEQSGSFPGEAQAIGPLLAPSLVVVSGRVGACGFDEEAVWPDWPSYPSDGDDDDDDDDEEEEWSRSGWYSGDVDIYSLSADFDAIVSVALRWENAPVGGSNSPYRPDDSSAGWTQESDLDFVLFSMGEQGLGDVITDLGSTTQHPESVSNILYLSEGVALGVVVACHHELPTDYSLELEVVGP